VNGYALTETLMLIKAVIISVSIICNNLITLVINLHRDYRVYH